MKPNDRTKEFYATVESILSRKNNLEQQQLLHNQYSPPPQNKSEFTHVAATIGKDINSTVAKLQRLTQLAKRRTLFDDNPTEINDLIQVVKQDIGKINNKIDGLQRYSQDHSRNRSRESTLSSKQAQEHSKNVIVSLQSKLATTSNEFKNVLEVRTQNMREQKSRRDQYGTSSLDTSKIFNNFGSPHPANNSNVLPLYQTNSPHLSSSLSNINNSSSANTNHSTILDGINLGLSASPSLSPSLNHLNTTPSNTNTTNSINNNNNNNYSGAADTVAPNLLPPLANLVGSSTTTTTTTTSTLTSSQVAANSDKFISIDMQEPPQNTSLGLNSIIGGGSQQQQQLLANPIHTDYLESRSQAIDSIESTIAELGQIYQHFAQVLAGQRETVQRIDDNIADVEMNVTGAQNQLMKYYNNISNNRWLILKVLGIVMIFFLIFVMFL